MTDNPVKVNPRSLVLLLLASVVCIGIVWTTPIRTEDLRLPVRIGATCLISYFVLDRVAIFMNERDQVVVTVLAKFFQLVAGLGIVLGILWLMYVPLNLNH